jgi:hypothetical protein
MISLFFEQTKKAVDEAECDVQRRRSDAISELVFDNREMDLVVKEFGVYDLGTGMSFSTASMNSGLARLTSDSRCASKCRFESSADTASASGTDITFITFSVNALRARTVLATASAEPTIAFGRCATTNARAFGDGTAAIGPCVASKCRFNSDANVDCSAAVNGPELPVSVILVR